MRDSQSLLPNVSKTGKLSAQGFEQAMLLKPRAAGRSGAKRQHSNSPDRQVGENDLQSDNGARRADIIFMPVLRTSRINYNM